MKFLIVDDSPAMRRCIRKLLPVGAQVFECSDGEDALQLTRVIARTGC